MQLELTPYSITEFMHCTSERALYADASDLKWTTSSRLFDDACDVGIAVFNPRTDSTTVWFESTTHNNKDNELLATIFEPTAETLRKYPATKGYRLFILND